MLDASDALCRVPSHWHDGASAGSPQPLPPVLAGAAAEGAALQTAPLQADIWSLTAQGSEPVVLTLPIGAEDHFAGGGMQFGRLDQAGRVLDGWCTDTAVGSSYFHAPVLHSSAGWTLIVDTACRYRLDAGASDSSQLSLTLPDGRLTAFLVAGPPRRGLEVLIELTGPPPLPPPWAFGVWHNVRSGHESVLAQARRLRDEQIPASALWIEDHYDADTNDGDGWPGNYPQGSYPDMQALVRELHSLGYRALTYVNPMLYRDTSACRDAVERGLVVTTPAGKPDYQRFFHPLHARRGMVDFEDHTAVPLDFTNPEAVSWWQDHARRLLADRGWDGWMEDFGEQIPASAHLHDGSSGSGTHNRYPLLYHGATAAIRGKVKPDSVVFARSGWLGSQRHANVYWGGDQLCSWDDVSGMPSVIAGGLSAALCGVSSWGLDITGIVTDDTIALDEGAGDRELWIRWCQLGALTPVMRTHLGFKPAPTPPLDVWHDPEMTAMFQRQATLHLRLFPYLYSLAAEAARGGLPIIRPLLLEYPGDEQCWTLSHEFLLGDALLVAPVIERGARSRPVYFPEGEWYELGSAARHSGPGWRTVEAPLDTIPVFQRAGSAVPLLADVTPVSLTDPSFAGGEYDMEILVTPGGDGRFAVHEGTILDLHDGTLLVRGRERSVLVRCCGHSTGLARGAELDFDLKPLFMQLQLPQQDSAQTDFGIIHAARQAEGAQGLHHDDRIVPEPARPGEPVTVLVRQAADVMLDSLSVRWTADGGDPVEGDTSQVRDLSRVGRSDEQLGHMQWAGELPGQPEGTVVRYAFEGRRGDEALWVEDAGPGLERPDLTTIFVRPPERRFSYAVTSRRVPLWLREATIYHILVDRFHPGGSGVLPRDHAVRFLQHAGGTIRGVTEHLGHVAELGADCILISPITRGEMHVPYDATDLFDVDPRLGTLADARELCREAHGMGIRVLLDAEFSMLGYRHPFFTDARRNPTSEYRDWFRWHEWPDRPYSWFGGRMLVTLNHAHGPARTHLLDAARFWLDVGFDGFRLDSAAMAPLDFWTEFGQVVRTANADAVTLGEVFGTPESLGHYRSRLDGVLDFTVPHALRECFASRAITPALLARSLSTMSEVRPEELAVAAFIENHDVPRFSFAAGGDQNRLRQALAVLLTLEFPPILYYGTEVGRRQGPRADMDPDARLPMLWGQAQDGELFEHVRRLVAIRRKHAALRSGRHVPLHADETLLAYARVLGDTCAVIATNTGTSTAPLSIDASQVLAPGTALMDAVGGRRVNVDADGLLRLRLVPGETLILMSE